MVDVDTRRQELKERFLSNSSNPGGRGWGSYWAGLLDLDPDFFDASERFIDAHWESGALDPKTRELIYVALAAHVTLLYEDGLRGHMQKAVKHGATKEELMEVLELTSVVGTHSIETAMPIIMEEYASAGQPVDAGPLTDEQQKMKDEFTTTGPRPRPWAPMYEGIMRLHPAYLRALMDYIDVPWRNGPLSPKVKELIYIAIDVACTHLFSSGLRRHVQKAIREGVTATELMEVLEIAAGSGFITCAVGVPILMELFEDKED